MEQNPFLALFFESVRSSSIGGAAGTETFTEVRPEDSDRDVDAIALGTETGTHARREENDQDLETELIAGTETFTRSRGEEGDRDVSPDDTSDGADRRGIWETTML
jgi:hypothetical protein